jgi:hypothetical protein
MEWGAHFGASAGADDAGTRRHQSGGRGRIVA